MTSEAGNNELFKDDYKPQFERFHDLMRWRVREILLVSSFYDAFVLEDGRFYWWFVNSIIIATITTISNLLFDSLVGYTLCKFRFPGRTIVFIAILSTLMIPTEMLVIPWYLMSQSFGWLDSYWGIMFPGMMTAFGTFLMKQFFESVPDDFIEAARIDGLNELQIWWTVAMPLVKPALAALAIFVFLGNWTAFLWPLIVTNSVDMYTIPVGLSGFGDEADVAWELIMTGGAAEISRFNEFLSTAGSSLRCMFMRA